MVKNLPAMQIGGSNPDSIPGLGRSPGEGNRNPLQYSCLENSMDRGAWQATVHGVAESDLTEVTNTHTLTPTPTTHPELPPPNPVSRKTHSRRASWKRWQKRVGSEAPKKREVLKGHLLDNFREWQRPPKVTEEERQRRDWNGNDNQG